MKRLFFLFLSILVIGSGYSGYRYYKHINRPEYKVEQLTKAIKNKDYNVFTSYVDVPILINNLYKTYKDKFIPEEDDGLISKIDSYLNLGLSSLFETISKSDINNSIEIYFKSKLDQLDILSSDTIQIISEMDYDSIEIKEMNISEKKHLITFTLFNKRYNHEFIFKSVWEKQGDFWRLINISNIGEITTMYKDLEKNRVNESAKKKTLEMFRDLEVNYYEGKTKEITLLGFIYIPRSFHKFHLTNMTNQSIVEYGLKLSYKDNQGYPIIETRESFKKPIHPKESIKVMFYNYNPFVLSEMLYGGVPDIDVTFIKYESGHIERNEEAKKLRFFE